MFGETLQKIPQLGESPLIPERLTYPVNDVAVLLGVSRRKVWGLIYGDKLPTVWIEGRRLVTRDALQGFVDGLTSEKPETQEEGS
jgi:hypothetical protein